jgi:hypothetical protein
VRAVTRQLAIAIGAAVGLSAAAYAVHGRIHVEPFARARPAATGSYVATPIDPGAVTTTELRPGVVGYVVPLPPGLIDADRLELRFRAALDGARVEAIGGGPRTHATLLRQRVGGDSVVVPLAPGRIDAVEVRVHRHLRPTPIVREVVVVAAATSPAPRPPPGASLRSPR